jgi:thioredoxin 1
MSDLMKKITVKNFWSRTLEECQVQLSLLKDLEGMFKGRVVFEYLNADENGDAISKYNIKHFPTIIIEYNGSERERFVGLTQERFLKRAIQKALSECK